MSPRPFASAARAYFAAGYGPLHLPRRKKAPPPEGFTGRNGRQVGAEDVDRGITENPSGNIGLLLPSGAAGIDVDAYKGADHVAAWEELTARCGPLPDAPWCSSRDDGISGIRLFRVPEDWEAAGKLPEGSNGVSPGEVIQWHHRYVVAPPSIHPDTGSAYQWRSGSITKVTDLPALPQPWLDALSVAAVPVKQPTRPVAAPRTGIHAGGRPGDDLNERADWLADILGPHGWELHHEAGGTLYVTRPGKSRRDGHSATIGHSKDGVERLYVFSADAGPFEMETPYTKFGAYALLNHGGDYQAAARELSRTGYGGQQPPVPVTPAGRGRNEPPEMGSHPADQPQTDGSSALAPVVQIGGKQQGMAWDPENPLKLLQEAALLERDDRAAAVVRAIKRMVHGGMDEAAEEQARAYVAREKLIPVASFTKVVGAERKKVAAAAKSAPAAGEAPVYYVEDGCTYWEKPTPNGPVPTMLATFTGEIAEEVTLDDGTEQTLTWLVRVTARDGRGGEVRITPDQLGRPQQWAAKAAGTAALVMPGMAIADHLRVAVQSGSRTVARKTVYTHTGWRTIGGGHVYLTTSGALGAEGLDKDVRVDLGSLSGYALPAVTDLTALREAIRASIGLLAITSDMVMMPLLASVYRAPLPLPADCSVWEYGRSGSFKTAMTALAQQHFGNSMDAYSQPGNWTSTANALEHQAHMLDSALFVVDDYSPDITKADAQRRAATADRLMRGSANRAARDRLRPDGTLRPDKPPRAQILVSAEDLPPDIPSLLARVFVAEVMPGSVSLPELTKAQGQAADGRFALAMAGYVTYLARRYDSDPPLPATLADVRSQLRDKAKAEAQHPRVALNVASLALGWREFLSYAVQAGAISERRRDELWKRAWKALRDVGAEQERYRRDADPVSVYLRSLAALVASGRAHLAAATMNGGMPENPSRWGWAEDTTGDLPAYRERGELLGWTDGTDVYLQPDATFKAVRQFAEGSGAHLGMGKRVLHKSLHERQLLVSISGPGHFTVQRDLAGQRGRRVLHLSVHTFEDGGAQ